MDYYKNEFPVLSEYTYLNTASSGLLSKSLTQWRHQHDLDFLNGGSLFRDNHKTHIESIRAKVSHFFDAPNTETALVPNFSFGFNALLEGLPKNSKVLLLRTDYPSINWAVEQRGFEVFYAPVDENLEQNIEAAVSKNHPDVFAFSLVQFVNGIKIDLDFLKKLKAYHPNLLLIADGTQFLGTTKFSFTESPLDVLGASAYKWLLAGYGSGFFMVKEEAQIRFFLKTIGFNSAENFETQRQQVRFIKQLEPGHHDTLNYGTLEQAIKMLENIGMEKIENQILKLSQFAKAEFSAMELLEEAVENRNGHSNIFNIKGDAALFQKLTKNKIICSQRGKGIRVGFHFYNSENDIERLIDILKSS